MKKDIFEHLEELKTCSAFNDAKGRNFIDKIIYKLKNKIKIDYYPKKDDVRNRIVKIVKDFENPKDEIKKEEKKEIKVEKKEPEKTKKTIKSKIKDGKDED